MRLRAKRVEQAWDALNGFLCALAILLLLAGCAAAPSRAQEGIDVQAPTGFVEWCSREPWQVACGGRGQQ